MGPIAHVVAYYFTIVRLVSARLTKSDGIEFMHKICADVNHNMLGAMGITVGNYASWAGEDDLAYVHVARGAGKCSGQEA